VKKIVNQINWPMMRTNQQQQEKKTKAAAATRTARKGMIWIWRFAHIYIKRKKISIACKNCRQTISNKIHNSCWQ
jgi:hypothetical protein